MRTSRLAILFAAACCTLLAVAPAHAQSARYVSSGGSDANDCIRPAPCFTLQRGVDATPVGGVLQVLDTGAYGSATIVRSITISGDGVSASVGRITINGSTIRVVLRGLLLNATGAAGQGITISAASSVHIVRCEIERFLNGIIVNSTSTVELFVTDSIVRNNSLDGLSVTSEGMRITVDGSRFENNTSDGISVNNGETNITRTVVSGNRADGIVITGFGSNTTIAATTVTNNTGHGIRQTGGRMNVASTTSSHNGGNGYYAVTGAEMTLTSTTAAHNYGHGYAVNGLMTLESSTASGNLKNGLAVLNLSTAVISNSVFTRNIETGIQNDGGVWTRRNNTAFANSGGELGGNALTTLTAR